MHRVSDPAPSAAPAERDAPPAPKRPWAPPRLILATLADTQLKHTFPTEGYGTSVS